VERRRQAHSGTPLGTLKSVTEVDTVSKNKTDLVLVVIIVIVVALLVGVLLYASHLIGLI
jgi:hypothetical protein